jgi:hypothetical protein
MRVVIEAWNETEREISDPLTVDPREVGAYLEAYRERGLTSITMHRLDVVCDFCNDPGVCNIFQIAPGGVMGTIVTDNGPIHHQDKDGKWGACAICTNFILKQDWDGLRARALEAVPEYMRDIIGLAIVTGPHACFQRGYIDAPAPPTSVISDQEMMNG